MDCLPRFFTVHNARLLGGEHPCPGGDLRVHRARIDALVSYGVTTFIDLTQQGRENGVQPYDRLLRGRSHGGLPVVVHNLPIPDAGVPTSSNHAERVLDLIDAALCNDECVYVHCRSGVGRTGMVLALHLVRHGAKAERALRLVQAAWRRDVRSMQYPYSPQTERQRAFVVR